MSKINVPPIKIQGIKTKIIPLIKDYVCIDDNTTWVEPFFGSGVVGFNIAPKKAIFADSNPYLIDFYNAIKDGRITSQIVRSHLKSEGEKLFNSNGDYYYEVRERFNKEHNPLDFLFLNRSCFNGVIRFNRHGKFNVPFGKKPNRFQQAYITKIVNQVAYVEQLIKKNDYKFVCQDFKTTISMAPPNSFIYCDPPYIGRSVDYYDSWSEDDEKALCELLKTSNNKFMVSTWDSNEFRTNAYINTLWSFCHKINKEHYYFVGGQETNRHPMVEALLMNYEPTPNKKDVDTQAFIKPKLFNE